MMCTDCRPSCGSDCGGVEAAEATPIRDRPAPPALADGESITLAHTPSWGRAHLPALHQAL
jgi:hypothetical protein